MKVKELMHELAKFNPEQEIIISSDEELNTTFTKLEVADLEDREIPTAVIYGLAGSEEDNL